MPVKSRKHFTIWKCVNRNCSYYKNSLKHVDPDSPNGKSDYKLHYLYREFTMDFFQMKDLTFEQPDIERFRCLALAYEALDKGGNMPCIVNAANEIANRAFIDDQISFQRISEIIEQAMSHIPFSNDSSLDTYLLTDKETREYAKTLL